MIHPTILSTVKPDGSVQRYEGACDQVEGTVSVDGLPEHFNPGDYARMFIQLPGGSFLVDYLGGNIFQIVE